MMFKDLLSFLAALKRNNNREWFEANREKFETLKQDFINVVGQIIEGIGTADPAIKSLNAKDCIFRQYRDIRFSKDKTPYKTHIGAYMNKGGKKTNTAGYYIHIEPGQSLIAGGLYHPETVHLRNVRQEIDYNLREWEQLTGDKNFKKYFPGGISVEDSLKRPPRGYDVKDPAIKYLMLKSFVFTKPLPDADLIALKDSKPLIKSFTALTPVVNFLNRADIL